LTLACAPRIRRQLAAGNKIEAIESGVEARKENFDLSGAAAIGAYAQHLGSAGANAPPTSTKSITIPIGPTVSRNRGRALQVVGAVAVIALLAVMLAKFTF
jgi:hypothetical protein